MQEIGTSFSTALLAGAVEYADCISAEGLRPPIPFSPFGWSCRIHWLLLWRGVRPPPNECHRYDIKSSDGETLALDIWGMWSTPSLSSFPGPLWLRVLAPDRALSMGQIEQTVCKQMTAVKLLLLYSNTWNHLTVFKKRSC